MSEISAIAQSTARPLGPPPTAELPVRIRQELAGPGKPPPTEPPEPPDQGAITEAVAGLNDFFKQERHSLEFSVDQASGRVVIRITDAETDQVIRQIPPEEVLAIVRHLAEGPDAGALRGLLLSESV
jgi:flagellar protein FlaG